MKAHYRTHNGQITFEIEGSDAKELFRHLASVQEVFDAERQCGMCGSDNLRFLARKVDDFDFYELACQGCRARFAFGQAKKGGALFPKRKDDDGNYLQHNGWSRFEPQSSAAPVPPVTPPPATMPRGAARPATPNPPKREMPIELMAHYERIVKNKMSFGAVCEKISASMVQMYGDAGANAYGLVAAAFERKFPRGTTDINDMRECLLDLWEAAENLTPQTDANHYA